MSKTLAGHTGGEGTTVGRVSLVSPRTGLTELTHKSLRTGTLLHPGGRVSYIRPRSGCVQLDIVNESNSLIVVGGPDLESCQVGQYGDEGLRVESGHPLGLLPLVQPVPKGLGLYGGLVISLHKDGGGEPLSGSLENDVNDRGPGVVFPYSQVKGQKLVVAESLVTQVTSWSNKVDLCGA